MCVYLSSASVFRRRLASGLMRTVLQEYSAELVELISLMLRHRPEERPVIVPTTSTCAYAVWP